MFESMEVLMIIVQMGIIIFSHFQPHWSLIIQLVNETHIYKTAEEHMFLVSLQRSNAPSGYDIYEHYI